MENKKQLLIIPPMSEPLQKLHEVLEGIAIDENIEISIIDDLKELGQFVGSSGQCLIAFANAKKCATFLQDNRFIVAKTHTKIILLTPKEIPAKTLIKFTKIGLTESILENSPPKTLLYKVKLLLRSIKSSGGSEDKELAVKTMSEGGPAQAQAKGEINTDKLQAEESSVNYLAEERAKFKKDQEGEAINYGENLKGKTSIQEESIETHWKSKRKKDDQLKVETENDVSKIEVEDSADIDMYYRGKKKSNELDIIESDESGTRKKLYQEPDEEDLVGKKIKTVDLDTSISGPEKRKKLLDEEEYDLQLKKSKETLEIEAAEEEAKRPKIYEEAEEEKKRKELLELEALFEEAKKRQEEKMTEDLGGHYKGKITNIQMDLDEPEETQEREEYDNSDLYAKEKPFDLEIVPVTEEKRRHMQEEDETEEKKRKGFGETIDSNMASDDGSTDHIETMMKSDSSTSRSENIKPSDIQDKKRKEEELADNEKEDSNKLDLDLATIESTLQKRKLDKEEISDTEREKSPDLNLEESNDLERKREKYLDDDEQNTEREAQVNLKLIDADHEARNSEREEEDESLSYRKLDKLDMEEDKNKARATNGKVDKIDTYYRSGDAKKKEHDWNLDEKKNNLDLGLEKSAKRGPDGVQKKESTDLGEQTIDYRKMREEFEAISRGEDIYEDGTGSGRPGGRKAGDDEDSSFKVVVSDPVGFDFAIEILNMIYQKEIRPEEFYKTISEELQKRYHAYPVFYSYKPGDKKHIEVFDSILKMPLDSSQDEIKIWWVEHKKDESIMADTQTKSMATWVCREMNWEDVELPSWASNELTNKRVELIYPYFDGVDRMGLAMVYFPAGIRPNQARGIEVALEMARTLLLDTIQRKTTAPPRSDDTVDGEETAEKKNILNVFSGLFKGKKAG